MDLVDLAIVKCTLRFYFQVRQIVCECLCVGGIMILNSSFQIEL
jgi:hypothetical protein